MNRLSRIAITALVLTALALPVSAQSSSATQADIQRLQDNLSQATSDLAQLRSRDAARADRLQAELNDLRDEVVYLKVKLRRERTLARVEYSDVRDRIEAFRTLVRGDAQTRELVPAAPPAPHAGGAERSGRSRGTVPATTGAIEIPAGTELDVRLFNSLSSATAQVEDRFEATTLVDLHMGNRTAIPAGSVMRGVVTAVEPATRSNRTARMTVSFDQLTIGDRAYPIRGTVTRTIEGEGLAGEAGRIGAGAGAGAIIGGILGGVRGALAGVIIGAGGTIAATEGKEIELPQGSVLRVRIESPARIGG